MPATKPIDLRFYKKEWEIVDKRIRELRKISDRRNPKFNSLLHNHIHNKMRSLAKDFKDCPECILESLKDRTTEAKRHHIPLDVYEVFEEMSIKSKVPITSIVSRLIIAPLLIEK